jgi:hypothetical protein
MPARRNSLPLIAARPNLASCGGLQIRGHFYCRNIDKRDISIVAAGGHYQSRATAKLVVSHDAQFRWDPQHLLVPRCRQSCRSRDQRGGKLIGVGNADSSSTSSPISHHPLGREFSTSDNPVMVVVAWLEWLFGKQIVGDVAVTAVIAQNKRPAAVRLESAARELQGRYCHG